MRRSVFSSSPARSLLGAIATTLALSCASAPKPEPEVGLSPKPPEPPPAAAPAGPVAPPLLPSQVLGMTDDETTAPSFARRGAEGVLLYGAKGRLYTRAGGADGTPKGEKPTDIGSYGGDGGAISFKPVGEGYVAVWTELVARNRAIKMLSIDAAGNAKGAPVLVAQIADEVPWADVVPNAKGALILWQIQHGTRSDLFMVPFNGAKIDGAPQAVARDALALEVMATERGAVVATVEAVAGSPAAKVPARKKKAKGGGDEVPPSGPETKLGKVMLTEVDLRGKAGPTVVVSPEPTAQVDVRLADVGGKYVVAWTDERQIDPCVFVATVEPGGKVAVAPHRATAPIGAQAFVTLVAAPYGSSNPRSKRALLVWEDQLAVKRDGRELHLATIGADGALGRERGTLLFSTDGVPDLVADGDGFAALTLAPYRELPPGVEAHAPPGVKGDVPVWFSFVRFGADLAITASEPLRAEPFAATDGVPYLTSGLSCAGGTCTALAAAAVIPSKDPKEPNANPAPIALLTLPVREGPWKAPAARKADDTPPRPVAASAIYSGDHLSRVTAAELGTRSLVAWVTYVISAPPPRRAPKKGAPLPPKNDGPTATIGMRAIGEDGTPGKPQVISQKALSIGGVSLAAAPIVAGKKPEAALAWVAREQTEAQVFVSRIGPDGEKLASKAVTSVPRKKTGAPNSEASDAAIAYAGGEGSGGDGWYVAWSDTRDNNAEIYVARLDRSLSKTIPDHRISDAPGVSAEPSIAVRGKDVFVVWADAREHADEGNADIYVARLDAATLKKTGAETRIFASATHSHAPQIVATPKGFLVSWIEDIGDGSNAADAGLRIAELDEKGGVVGAPQLVKGEGTGGITSAALTCAAKGCRGVLTSSVSDSLVLGAFEVKPGAPAGPAKIIAALGGPPKDASPAFAGSAATSLFFSDDALSAGRVRWMQLLWP